MAASKTRSASLVAFAAAVLAGCASTPGAKPAPALAAGPPQADRNLGDASVYGLYLAGEAAIDRGSSHDAAYFFSQASLVDPGSTEIRTRAFTAALVAGEVSDAARIAASLPDGPEPVNGLAKLTRAVEAIAEGHGSVAVALLSNPAISGPHAAAAQLVKAWAAAQAGDWKTAAAAPTVGANPVLITVATLGRAEILEHEGKFDEAENIFKAHASPKNGLFVLGYGGFLERRGRYAEAIALYQKAFTAKPDDMAFANAKARAVAKRPAQPAPTLQEGAAEALVAPAVLMLAQHQGDSGLGYLRLALRLDPNLDEAWVLVGDSMTNAGDAGSAKEAYGHVKAGSEQFTVARSDLALALQNAGDKEGALALTRETMADAPNDPRVLSLYADLLNDDDRFDDAVAALTKAINQVGHDHASWSLFYLRGAAEERAGRWPDAEADLKKALSLNPDEPEVMNYLGYAWVDRGEHLPEAVELLERAESKAPDSGAIIDSLGWARFRTHDYASAIIDLERAIELDPADPEVNDHLGDVYWRVGRRLEAQYQWNRVLTLGPDDKRRKSVEGKLREGLGAESPPAPRVIGHAQGGAQL